MTDHSEFEVQIEMRQHGALDAAAALDAHLEGCDACRRYQALVRRSEDAMTTQAATLNLETLDARIQAEHQRVASRWWVPVAVMSALTVALILAGGKPLPVLLSMGSGAALLAVMFGMRILLDARNIAGLERKQEDFLAFYRRMLRRRIRLVNVLMVFIPLAASNVLFQRYWPASLRSTTAMIVTLVPITIGFIRIVVARVRDVPRLKRELADLEKQ